MIEHIPGLFLALMIASASVYGLMTKNSKANLLGMLGILLVAWSFFEFCLMIPVDLPYCGIHLGSSGLVIIITREVLKNRR